MPSKNNTFDRSRKLPASAFFLAAFIVLIGISAQAVEIIKDNADTSGVTIQGTWTTSTSASGFNGSNYLHDGKAGKGTKSILFTPSIPKTGQYLVYGRWIAGSDRAANVPFTITHAGGTANLQVDQRVNGAQWFLLGTYTFNAGTTGSILIATTGTTGYVIADAVRLVSSDEIIKDNTDASGVLLTGTWTASTSVSGYIGANYIHDSNGVKGGNSVRFSPAIPSTGTYSVYLRWTSGTDRSSNVPVDVSHAGGTALLQVDQKTNGGKWVLLGVYTFNAGSGGNVLVSNTGTSGVMVVDAVRFVPGQPDQDGDGMTDAWETANGLNPNNPNDGSLDPDGDGLTNLEEFLAGTNPNVANGGSGSSTITASVQTSKAYEKEGTPAYVRFNRTGGTGALTINFATSGVAGSSDYTIRNSTGTVLTNSVVLPAGATSVTLTIQPTADSLNEYPETATITVSSGAGYSVGSPSSALVTVNDATNIAANEKLFVANLAPAPNANTSASGTATLMVSGSNDQARVEVTFFGLTSSQTNAYIRYGVTSGVGPELRPNLGVGQLSDVIWNIVPEGPYSGQDIIDGLFRVGGKFVYTNIGTTNYPGGEIQGTWNRQTGSSTFTPPANPPAITPITGAELTRDVARFLTQATFGPTNAEIDALVNSINTTYGGNRINAFNAWIDTQLGYDQTLMFEYYNACVRRERTLRSADPEDSNYGRHPDDPDFYAPNFSSARHGWWLMSVHARDQLRQRFAFAASEIWVISSKHFTIQNAPRGYSQFYDMLGSHATGNFRDLIESVSKHPMMGRYLSSLNNQKAVLNSSGEEIISPDENYAREVMQLFSIGLLKRHPDGSLQLGGNGLPIQTYNNTDITNMARVFTGWSFSKTIGLTAPWPTLDNDAFFMSTSKGRAREAWTNPMKNFAAYHDTGSKTVLGTVIPAGLDGEADLDAAMNILYNHPNTPPFISRLLIQRLVASNPSNGYIYRVAQKFINNGSGVRGDMKAVIKAILLDHEARTLSLTLNPAYGKQKEPIVRKVQQYRVLNIQSSIPLSNLSAFGYPASQLDNFPANTTHLLISETHKSLGQTPQKAPTVFNFFSPDYSPGGAIGMAGLVAPEMQITTENGVVNGINANQMTGKKHSPFELMHGVDPALDDYGVSTTEVEAVYDNAITAGQTVVQATTTTLDYLDTVMTSGMLKVRYGAAPEPNPRSILINAVSGMSHTTTAPRIRELIHLLIVSPEYIHQK